MFQSRQGSHPCQLLCRFPAAASPVRSYDPDTSFLTNNHTTSGNRLLAISLIKARPGRHEQLLFLMMPPVPGYDMIISCLDSSDWEAEDHTGKDVALWRSAKQVSN